jgi:transcriptional regulator with XRE-family HTH domain
MEQRVIGRTRTDQAEEFALTERILDFGSGLILGRRIANPEGDALLGRIVIGHLVKSLQLFWAVIVLAERGLPTSSLVRELAETVISLAYLLAEDSAERAQLYRDHLTIRDLRDMNARMRDPDTEDIVTHEYRRLVEAKVQELRARRGQTQFESMRRWETWAGSYSLETLAQRAGFPGTIYNLLYRVESRATHALDLAAYLTVTPSGYLLATLPATAERHLMPSAMLVLTALHLGIRTVGLGREDELEALREEVLQVRGAGGPLPG